MIKVQNAKKVYKMGNEVINALAGVSFDIKDGEFIAIVGPSGSGKSTLLHVIGGLDHLDDGKIMVNQKELSDLKDKQLARYRNATIGFVFQKFNLQPRLNALENVELPLIFSGMGKKERREKAEQALRKVDLTDRSHHKPGELSGGQQQRVSIARSLVNNPQIILADEPTGNLDSKTGEKIVELLKELNRKFDTTVIVVTHDDRIAHMADRILRILDGKIVEDVMNGKKEMIEKHTD